jgi:hypothetical protein
VASPGAGGGRPDAPAGRLEFGTGIPAGAVVLQPVSGTSGSSRDVGPRPCRRLGGEQGDRRRRRQKWRRGRLTAARHTAPAEDGERPPMWGVPGRPGCGARCNGWADTQAQGQNSSGCFGGSGCPKRSTAPFSRSCELCARGSGPTSRRLHVPAQRRAIGPPGLAGTAAPAGALFGACQTKAIGPFRLVRSVSRLEWEGFGREWIVPAGEGPASPRTPRSNWARSRSSLGPLRSRLAG